MPAMAIAGIDAGDPALASGFHARAGEREPASIRLGRTAFRAPACRNARSQGRPSGGAKLHLRKRLRARALRDGSPRDGQGPRKGSSGPSKRLGDSMDIVGISSALMPPSRKGAPRTRSRSTRPRPSAGASGTPPSPTRVSRCFHPTEPGSGGSWPGWGATVPTRPRPCTPAWSSTAAWAARP